jgi:hypothetical protein
MDTKSGQLGVDGDLIVARFGMFLDLLDNFRRELISHSVPFPFPT